MSAHERAAQIVNVLNFELFILLLIVFVFELWVFGVYIVICMHNAHLPENRHRQLSRYS